MLKDLLRQLFKGEGLKSHSPLTGGDINDVYRVETRNGTFALKLNDARKYPRMFETEANGLALLKDHSEFVVPRVIKHGENNGITYLIMEFIHPGSSGYPHEDAGRKLAEMHLHNQEQFGLDHSNYIGSLPQSNTFHSNWLEFYREERILPLLSRTEEYFSAQERQLFDGLFKNLNEFFPEQPASLLHGDLWSGNTFTSHTNEAVLIDPAVYYGHYLMDLGMTRLFGGFRDDFYLAYNEINPLENNWQEACQIANLYPLLVHLDLFGSTYKGQIISILSTYS